ncbi:MAG TPA: hypothetical protein VFJ16_18040 [Longimicrobium sp.]|nr:hypothetical protein [Longimicrobium sp.]
MKPIKLEMDTIRVESFATAAADGGAGTVMAHGTDADCASNQATCDTCQGPNCTNVCPAVG